MKEYNFDDFLTDYKQEALQINLSKEYPLVFEILEKQKLKLNSADFEEVIDEVIEFCKNAIKNTKESLIISFSNKHYIPKFKNGNPAFLSQMKIYIEYGNLYKDAINKKSKNQLFEFDKGLKNTKLKNQNQQMDYIDVILRGYSNENDRKFLSKYFIRECKKAEDKYYSFEEYFNGLVSAIDKLKDQYKTRLNKRKTELYFMLSGAKNDTLKYGDLKDESIEERNKQMIEYCKSELSEISFENFPINLLHLTNDRYRGFLNYSEVEFIGNEIAQAFIELNKNQQSEPQKSEKPKPQGKTLQQFFKDGTDLEIIKTLQTKYKELNGKKMAYLIYLLHKEFNLINYSLRGTKDSRKRFVNEFTGKNINNIEGINKIFDPNDITLGIDKYHKDNDYITIQNEIQTILDRFK